MAGAKSSGATKIDQKSVIDSDDYYQQVERYAEQIRKTSSADEIISILDIVLSETRGLRFSNEVFAAQEQVRPIAGAGSTVSPRCREPGTGSVVAASVVWSVERRRWPVIAALTAMPAVSRSRISPTMMAFGS